MLSNHRESLGVDGSSVCELLEPSGDVVEAHRINDAIAGVRDGARKLCVLVVDDNRDCADSLSMLVNLWGDDALTAYDGVEALAMTVDRQPDVVLMDLAMPKMDGCRMARLLRLQTRFKQTLLIAITGYADQAHRLLCDEAGFDHCLIKPLELADLESLLRGERRRLAQLAEANKRTEETRTGLKKTEVLPCWS